MGSLLGFLAALALLIWGIATSTRPGELLLVRGKPVPRPGLARPGRLVGSILGAVALYYLFSWSILVVPGGHIACLYDPLRGGIQDYALPEGLRVVPPWAKTQIFSVQTQEYTMSVAPKEGAVLGDDSIRCETNEGLKVVLDLTVLFHVDPTHALQLWRKLGSEYNVLFVRPAVRERIRMVVAKYSVQDIYSGRRR